VGLYEEQAVESWHGFYKENAAKYTAQTEVRSCANFVRAMADTREASDSNLLRVTRRNSAKEGGRSARQSGDKRMRKHRSGGDVPECRAAADMAIKEGRHSAESIFKEGDRTIVTFPKRMASDGD